MQNVGAHHRTGLWAGHGVCLRIEGLLTAVIFDLVRDRRRMMLMNACMVVRSLTCWYLECDGDPSNGTVRSNMRLDLFHYGDNRGEAITTSIRRQR